MMLSLITTVFLTQLFVLWFSLGLSWICVVAFGTIGGAGMGLLIFWSCSELTLLIQNLSKVDVTGKCVLITGCDSGFGLMLAQSLAKRNMFVFAGVLSLDSTGSTNLEALPTVKVVKMDVTVDKDVKQAFEIVNQHLVDTKSVLWAVVNNAGIGILRFLEFATIEDFRQINDVNCLGLLRVCQTFIPLLRGHGRIVNITSILGSIVNPFFGGYCASKFAAEAVSKCLRVELHALNVPVITVQPSLYKTPILSKITSVYGDAEVDTYGRTFMTKCVQALQKGKDTANENILEVIDCLESAILNKKFQYNYIPNTKIRLIMNVLRYTSDETFVKTGCQFVLAGIPTTLD